MSERVLSPTELNRATLARQLLLERAELGPVEAIERVVALQAQEPASPFVGIWSRLMDFRADDLDRAFRDRRVVKGTLFRMTLHAVSAADYLRFWPAMQPTLRMWRERGLRRFKLGVDLDRVVKMAVAYATEPRTNAELAAHLPRLRGVGPAGQTDTWWVARPNVPIVHAPAEVPWSFGRRPAYAAAAAWLGDTLASEADGLDHHVRRYLAGFGPASIADLARFTRIERGRLKPSFERLTPELRRFRDEAGKLLHDVAEGPLPAADTPAPVRFLPMWDSVHLAYESGGRVLPEPYRRRIVQANGDHLATFLVDGHVAGIWRAVTEEERTEIRWHSFEPLARSVEKELAEEADRLARFVEPVEPGVYRRYEKAWMRSAGGEDAAAPFTAAGGRPSARTRRRGGGL
jgi:hypothetical protein